MAKSDVKRQHRHRLPLNEACGADVEQRATSQNGGDELGERVQMVKRLCATVVRLCSQHQ
jgi:hypothetical protein